MHPVTCFKIYKGFTLVELVLVIVILGVISVTALPMLFSRTDFEQRGFFDELLQATRYAQKLAVASNCDVQVTLNSGDFALAFLNTPHAHCANAAISLPSKQPPYDAPSGVTLSAGTGTITFHPSGLASADRTVTVTGTSPLSFRVYAATGYVERQ
jgi:MSHA pilin protein MshC